MNRQPRRLIVAAATAALVSSLTACGSDPDMAAAKPADPSLAIHELKETAASASFLMIADEIVEFLPNRTFVGEDSAPTALADGVVVGTVVDTELLAAGRVVKVADGEEEHGADQPLDPKDPDADWRHVGVTVEIDEGWGPAAKEKNAEFVVNINGGLDEAEFRASVETWGRIVAVLRQPIPGSPSGDAFRIPHAGTLIGLVADDDSISFPLMDPSEAERFLGSVRTVDDLRKEAAKQPVVIDQAARVG